MSNVRFLVHNLADSATISASTTQGSLLASNLKSDLKGLVHRSTSTSVTYTLSWTADQTASAVAIPACNLTSNAMVTVTLLNSGGGTLFTSTQSACPGSLNVSDTVTANHFAYGQASKVVVWLPKTSGVRLMTITLSDATNPAGFIDCARLVVGDYWQPTFGAGYSAEYTAEDLSQSQRTDAGDLLTRRQPVIERLSFSLNAMNADDRTKLSDLVRQCGVYRNFLVALVPSSTDDTLRHDSMVYGKRQNSAIRFDTLAMYSHQFVVESW